MLKYVASFLLLIAYLDLTRSRSSFSCSDFTREYYPVNVLVLVPLPDRDYDPAFDQGYSIIPAVELAAEQINGRTDILPGLDLVPNIKDTGCDKQSKTALESVTLIRELLVTTNGPVGIIGPACSEDSIFIASTFADSDRFKFNTGPLGGLPVLYSGTTPYLSENVAAFPSIYGMISPADILIGTLMRIAEEENWNWKNIAVLYDQTRQHFTHTYTAFVNQFNDSQEIGYTRQIADSQIPLGEIINRNIRIVVVFSDKKPARQLACLAGQSTMKFTFPIQQFIFIERSLEDFLGDENAESSFIELSVGKRYYCDKETVMRGLNGSVLLNQALDSVDPDVVTVSKYTAGQIKQQYRERLLKCAHTKFNTSLPESSYAFAYYDAMWAFAHSLNSVLFIPNTTFDDLHNAIQNISFQGVSSWIDFKNRQHVSNDVIISQVTGSSLTPKGLQNKTNLTYSSETFISDEFKTENSVLHPSLVALGLLLILVLFISTLIIQILMIVYREYPSVKASSSRLNHFIYLGCYLLTVSIAANTFRQIVPATNGDVHVLCNMDVMSSNLACTLIFGTILAKSWRAYQIFNRVFKSKSHYSLHDATLSAFIITLTLIQAVLFIPMLVVSPFQEFTSFFYDSSEGRPIKRLKSVCDIQSVGYLFLPIIFLLCIILATVVLATLNRKIRRKNFRQTKQILILVYTLTIMWAIGALLLVLFYYLQLSLDLIYFFYTFLLTTTVLLCQILLIIPFLIPVARGQKVNRLISNSSSSSLRRSTQLSILSDRRSSFLNSIRRSFLESQPDHRSSLQIRTKRQSSLQTNPIEHLINPPIRNHSTSTMRNTLQSCSSTDSQISPHNGPIILSTTASGGLKTRMILHNTSDSVDRSFKVQSHSVLLCTSV